MCFPKAHLTDLLSWVKKWVRPSDEGEGLHVFRVRAVSPCISPGILPHAHVSHTRFKWPQASDTRKATGHDTEEQTGCNSCSCHLALLFMGYIQAQGQFSSSCQWVTRSQNIAIPLFPLMALAHPPRSVRTTFHSECPSLCLVWAPIQCEQPQVSSSLLLWWAGLPQVTAQACSNSHTSGMCPHTEQCGATYTYDPQLPEALGV